MTTEQAVAILKAERVLQDVGSGGPDCATGSAWYNYVDKAVSAIADDTALLDTYNEVCLVRQLRIIHRYA